MKVAGRKLKFPMVATRDIGLVSAQALFEGPRRARVIELAGPTQASAEDVAAAASVFGRPVKAIDVPLDAIIPTLVDAGATSEFAALFRELDAGIASGHVTGRTATNTSAVKRSSNKSSPLA